MPDAQRLFSCLGESTRLLSMLLVHRHGELCVCELSAALDQSQPKVSRHLAQLRNCQLLQDRRQGQWVFYRLHPELPEWVGVVLEAACAAESAALASLERRLAQMPQRPQREAANA